MNSRTRTNSRAGFSPQLLFTLVFAALIAATAALAGLAPQQACATELKAAGLQATDLQAQDATLTLGRQVSDYVDDDDSITYTFKTTSRHSAYAIEIICHTDGTSAAWRLEDSYGNYIDDASTSTNRTDSVLLSTNSTYTITVSNWKLSHFSLKVTEVPSKPLYSAKGNNKNSPYRLKLGKAANSQFDDRTGSQVQYFTFKTTGRHSAYAINLFSRMDDRSVSWRLYDRYGNYIDDASTSTMRTDNVLLKTNETYTLELSGWYNGDSGFTSYRLKVSEVVSKPQYKALGNNKNKPYKLKNATTVSSQFDDRTGDQEQWFTFKTGSSKKYPYIVKLTSKTRDRSVTWTLYDYYGNYVDSASTETMRTDSLMLEPNMRYRVKVSGWYNGDSGFTSYQLMVATAHPNKVKGVKLAAGKKQVKVKYKAVKLKSGYQIAYKKAGTKSWHKLTTSKKVRTVKKLKSGCKYSIKVRAYYDVAGSWGSYDRYYGPWSSVMKVKVK